MIPPRFALAVTAIAFGLLTACSSSTGSNSCQVSVGPTSLGNVNISVTYHASATGDAHMTSVVYMTDAGNQTEQNPTLPWQKDINLTGGTQAQITGNVAYGTGTGTVAYSAFGGNTSDSTDNQCGGGT